MDLKKNMELYKTAACYYSIYFYLCTRRCAFSLAGVGL